MDALRVICVWSRVPLRRITSVPPRKPSTRRISDPRTFNQEKWELEYPPSRRRTRRRRPRTPRRRSRVTRTSASSASAATGMRRAFSLNPLSCSHTLVSTSSTAVAARHAKMRLILIVSPSFSLCVRSAAARSRRSTRTVPWPERAFIKCQAGDSCAVVGECRTASERTAAICRLRASVRVRGRCAGVPSR